MSNDAVKDHLLDAFLDEELSHQDVDKLLELLECEDTRARACRQAMVGSMLNTAGTRCVDISAAVRSAIQQDGPLQPLAASGRRRAQLRWFGGRSVAQGKPSRRRWQVPASGVALAASVALAAVVVVKPAGAPTAPAVDVAEVQTVAEPSPAAAPQSVSVAANTQPTRGALNRPAAALINPSRGAAQLVAAGNTSQRSSARELVIASPQQERPVVAQWSLAGEQNDRTQQLAKQQRVQQQLNTYLINHARHGGGSALPGSLSYARVAAQPAQRTGTE